MLADGAPLENLLREGFVDALRRDPTADEIKLVPEGCGAVFYLRGQRLGLLAQYRIEMLEAFLGRAREVIGVDLFDLDLQAEKIQQVLALVRPVHTLHQRGLALAFRAIRLAVRMQGACELAENLS